MGRLESKNTNQLRRKNRVRKTLARSPDVPRLSVFISNKNISAQVIDDKKNATLVSASTISQKKDDTMTKMAEAVGKEIAKKAKTKKVSKVKFDRGSKLYHGRIKAFADAARKEGLEF